MFCGHGDGLCCARSLLRTLSPQYETRSRAPSALTMRFVCRSTECGIGWVTLPQFLLGRTSVASLCSPRGAAHDANRARHCAFALSAAWLTLAFVQASDWPWGCASGGYCGARTLVLRRSGGSSYRAGCEWRCCCAAGRCALLQWRHVPLLSRYDGFASCRGVV